MSRRLDISSAGSNVVRDSLRISVDDVPAKAQVVREGYQVPTVNLDKQQTAFLLDNLVAVTPRLLPRVVSQNIPAGTKVIQGTVVDLIFAPKDSIGFGIFDNLHVDLRDKTLNHVDELVDNSKTRELLLKNETAGAVQPAEKDFLISEFQKKGIRVDEADPERTFNKAFGSVRSAVAFR